MDLYSDALGELVPMSIPQTLLPQGHEQGHFRPELIDLRLHRFRNLQYMHNFFILEVPYGR